MELTPVISATPLGAMYALLIEKAWKAADIMFIEGSLSESQNAST